MTSAHQLADTIRDEKIDVLLVDYVLSGDPASGETGLTAVKELRDKGFKIPVILFTGWPDLIDANHAKELGVLKILNKPVGIQDLRLALTEAREKFLSDASENP